jgi:hypothetical protein
MATRTTVTWVDDLDQTEADDIATATFGLDGELFAIDLKPENYAKLSAAFAPFIDHGRAISRRSPKLYGLGGSRGGKQRAGSLPGYSAPRTGANRTDLADIRAWAAAEGFTISDRGPISEAIIAKYDKCNEAEPAAASGVPTVILTPPLADEPTASDKPEDAPKQDCQNHR